MNPERNTPNPRTRPNPTPPRQPDRDIPRPQPSKEEKSIPEPSYIPSRPRR